MSTPQPTRGRELRLAVAGGLLVVLALVAQLTAPSAGQDAPETVPVAATDLICPDVRNISSAGVRTVVSAVTPRVLTEGDTGRALVGTLTRPNAFATISGKTFASESAPGGEGAPVIGAATGGRAPGFAMDQLMVSPRAADHGLAGTPCTEPVNDAWFVGPGSDVGHAAKLYLTDIESTPARVDITLYGKNGRIEAPGGLGVEVGGNSRRVVALDQLAPAAGVLAVRVRATAGRVGAAVLDTEVSGLEPRGADWVPRADAPATRVVVPGLASGPGSRRLTVFAPGEGSATVRVRLIGKEGSFAPAGADRIELDRGKVTSVELGDVAGSDDTAVLLESDAAMIAGVRWVTGTGSTRDYAFTAGVGALTGPAVMAGNRATDGYSSTLLLTAAGDAAKVSVQTLNAGLPRGKPVTLSVGADRTIKVVTPNAGSRGAFQVVITPVEGTGAVHGAIVRARKVGSTNGITTSLVRPARVSVAVPAARPDADVGLGR